MSPGSKTEREVMVRLTCDADVAVAVLETRRQCQEIGFNPRITAAVGTAVSELARNILAYAGEGQVTLRALRTAARRGVELCAEDEGPGIDDLELALTDHYSTGKTLGLGLPGVRRLMDQFEIHSAPGQGTRVIARKWK